MTVTKRWKFVGAFVFALGGIAALLFRALAFVPVDADAAPYDQPPTDFDYAPWESALSRWVKDGSVDYGRVQQEQGELERFVATLAVNGPRTTPARFATKSHELAYYINAYNALVLQGVMKHWPIDTVHDVRRFIEPKAGFGFFYGLRFVLDASRVDLYNLEQDTIRGYGDARIHAAINCASRSCPAVAPRAYLPDTLDAQLDAATRAFCKPPHVVVDGASETIRLSAIFDWYRDDFVAHASGLGRPATILGFIETFAEPQTRAELERARTAGFAVSFQPYNWSLNRY